MASEQVDYVDESLLDRVHRSRSFTNGDDGVVETQERRDELPEELMSQLENHIGDGLARVTVSGELSSSHEYHGAKSFVSISVSCNNDMGDVAEVHDILRPTVQDMCRADHEEMSLLRDEILPRGKKLHGGKTQSSTVSKRPPQKKAPGKQPGSSRGYKVSVPKGVKKPTFRR
jgi:hypothetical protein